MLTLPRLCRPPHQGLPRDPYQGSHQGLRPGMRWLLLIIVWLLALFVGTAAAQALQPIPPLSGRVVDRAGLLDSGQRHALEEKLRAFEQRKGSQVAVLLVRGTQPESIEQYAIRVAEQWKLGRQKVDDGAILVIAADERRLRIEVGYGLEGVLNDAVSRRIIDEIIVPRFKSGDFGGGVTAGVDAMLRVIDGESLPEPQPASFAQQSPLGLLPLVFFAALMVGGIMRALLGRAKGAWAAGGLLGLAAWLLSGTLLLAMLSALFGFVLTLVGGRMGSGWQGGRGHYGNYGGPGWGQGPPGGWGGGSSGGGFSGGGGGFGGGGASGRW